MTIKISNAILPGVYTQQESFGSVSTNASSPADVGVVGEADLDAGSATANTVYSVTTVPQASRLFGDGSPLTEVVEDALLNGAYPVYAVATSMVSVSAEDISSIGGVSGAVNNAPVSEVAENTVFTVDGTDKTTKITFNDPIDENPLTDEVYLNPSTGEFQVDSQPAGTAEVTYKYADYTTALAALMDAESKRLDVVGAATENTGVRDDVLGQVNAQAQSYKFMIGVIGVPYITDPSSYTNPLDTSRMQMFYGSRDEDGVSYVGAILGIRARIGLDLSAMRQRLLGVNGLYTSPTRSDKESLGGKGGQNLVVIEEDARGVRLMNDPTCVAPDNAAESAFSHGIARLAADHVTEVVHRRSDQFIGRLHTRGARAALKAAIDEELDELLDLNAIIAKRVTVEEIDSTTARVEVAVELAAPLTNIEAIIVGGSINEAAVTATA